MHLKVERKGKRCSLDEIPWSYSVFKMSWADWFIVVDW
ncbi:contractile injection system tape measure protein [Okeania hirsuta]